MATQTGMNELSGRDGLIESWPAGFDSGVSSLQPRPKAALLGLPCADCKAYFAADLEVCPICGCNERVVIGKRVEKGCGDVMRVVSQRGIRQIQPTAERLHGRPAQAGQSRADGAGALRSEHRRTLTLPTLTIGIPLEKVNQYATSTSIGLAAQPR